MDLSNRIGLYWLLPTFQSLNCVDIHKSLVGPILCQKILIYKKNVQRYIHGNNYMTLMAHFTHCNVENSPRGQAASSSLEKSALPCLVLEWPLLCARPVASVSSEELTISLGSPSNFSVYHSLSPDGESCFLQLCLARLSQGVPLPGSSRNAQLCVGHNALIWTGGRKWRMLLA